MSDKSNMIGVQSKLAKFIVYISLLCSMEESMEESTEAGMRPLE